MRLYSRLGNNLTDRFPAIVDSLAQLPCCTLDGEAAACDDAGLPSFNLLRYRQRDDRVLLYAFDLLELAGEDLRPTPLERRKLLLRQLLRDAGPGVPFSAAVAALRTSGELGRARRQWTNST